MQTDNSLKSNIEYGHELGWSFTPLSGKRPTLKGWQERPLAAVVLHEGAGVTPEQLRDYLSDKVVRWWLPERWTFVEEIPRTSVGKYYKKAIRARHADGAYRVVTLD